MGKIGRIAVVGAGVGLMIAGIVVGLYVGVWLCFIGGIVQIVNEINAGTPVEAMNIALGIVRILFAGLCGWLAGFVLFIPGMILLGGASR